MNLRNISMVYILNGESLLLIKQTGSRIFEDAFYCGIGGNFEPQEINDPTLCVLREMNNKTGMTWGDLSKLKLRYITTQMTEREIQQQYIFFAELTSKPDSLPPCDEGELTWIYQRDLFEQKMPFSDEQALRHYYSVGRYDDGIYAGCVETEKSGPAINWIKLEKSKTEN